MCGRNGLSTLEMGVRGHEYVLEPGGLINHHLLESTCRGIELGRSVHGPETRCSCNLIVPTAARVELGCNIPYFIVQHPIDEGMNVLIGCERLSTGGKLLPDGTEPALDSLAFLEG
jgi:hypothetical protein